MKIRRNGILGRMVTAAQDAPPLWRVTLPPRLARFLVAAGAKKGK